MDKPSRTRQLRGDGADAKTMQLLGELPADLRDRGWALSPADSRRQGTQTTPWYRAVYVRPFADRLDRSGGSWPIYDRRTRDRIVRISTFQDRSASWEDARRDAIRRMRALDAQLRDPA